MTRKIDLTKELSSLNPWVRKSMELFGSKAYLDLIHKVYPFQLSHRQEIDADTRRKIIQFHNRRETKKLIELLRSFNKFPYEDPVWYILKTVKGCLDQNPQQVERIARNLYSMTAEETLVRLEAPPELNTQTGPMFRSWLIKRIPRELAPRLPH